MEQPGHLTDAEKSRLKAVRSDEEWDQAYYGIQQAHGGHLPNDWWETVIQSGLAESVMEAYGAKSNASFRHFSPEEDPDRADN
jgi:hypothetical protein